jgi:nucleotide-binding universal stress UspA family protein
MFNRIMAATDIITTADAPVESAIRIARQQGAHLYLLHVMESASTEDRRLIRHFDTGVEMRAGPSYENALGKRLAKTYRNELTNIPHEVQVTAGFPWEEILRWARTIDTDLIVLGPHSTRAQKKGVVRIAGRVGSTVENVITRETCPVMIVNRPADKNGVRFQRVLVAVEFSRSCECALYFATKLAAHYASRLYVFHMVPVPPIPKYTRSAFMADVAHARKRLELFYAACLEETAHEYLIRGGAIPHLEIVKAVIEKNIDLAIMGSHTKEKSGKWYPGSAVERVGYRAVCPVVVVTDPRVLAHWDGAISVSNENEKNRRIHVFTKTSPVDLPARGGMP